MTNHNIENQNNRHQKVSKISLINNIYHAKLGMGSPMNEVLGSRNKQVDVSSLSLDQSHSSLL